MQTKTVTSTEFRAKAGQYLDDAAKAPVIITKHSRPSRVLIDIDFFEHLLASEKHSQKIIPASELSDHDVQLIRNSKPGPRSLAAQERLGEDESGLDP